MRKLTPERIKTLEKNQLFVFGSNTEGRHGKGAAKLAEKNFGAIHGIAEGLQGHSYAIITKELRPNKKSITMNDIMLGICKMVKAAKEFPQYEFLVTKIGCGLAAFTESQIKSIFLYVNKTYPLSDNIILPKEFEFRPEPE